MELIGVAPALLGLFAAYVWLRATAPDSED